MTLEATDTIFYTTQASVAVRLADSRVYELTTLLMSTYLILYRMLEEVNTNRHDNEPMTRWRFRVRMITRLFVREHLRQVDHIVSRGATQLKTIKTRTVFALL